MYIVYVEVGRRYYVVAMHPLAPPTMASYNIHMCWLADRILEMKLSRLKRHPASEKYFPKTLDPEIYYSQKKTNIYKFVYL